MAGVKISFLGTGAGASIHAAHTAIVLDSPDGTKVLLDASSGNSVFRNSASIGMAPEQFRHVLLSHDHADHMLGLPLIQLVHSRADPDGPPLEVHSGPSTLENVRLLCRASTPNSQSTAKAQPTVGAKKFTNGIPALPAKPPHWAPPPTPLAFR